MALTHALSTNNYGPAKFIVATSAANGTHTTLTSAMADASAGDTIFLRDSVTENVTITPGVNIAAWTGSILNTPSITGKLTMTGAGTSTISGIKLITNSDFILAVTGSAASIINLINCYLSISNNTAISHTSSSSSSQINIYSCSGDIGTTLITPFISTSAGTMLWSKTRITNSGGSSTTSSTSTSQITMEYCNFSSPITTSSTGTFVLKYTTIDTQNQNVTSLTLAGTGVSSSEYCIFASGSASAISVGAGTTLNLFSFNEVSSTNTNAITGAGTLVYSSISFSSSSSTINVTTQTPRVSGLGQYVAKGQSCFMAYCNASTSNNTGDGTAYTLLFQTSRFDQASNFSSPTFTAPLTGKYLFTISCLLQNALTTHQPILQLVTTAITYSFGNNAGCFAGNNILTASVIADMTAGDTASAVLIVSGGTKTVGVYGNAGDPRTTFSGHLVG